MAPIRVGIIGLSTKNNPNAAGGWGVNAHLSSYQTLSDKYQIVAVANTSVESSQRSIDYHKLGSTVKAYGNPEDIAKDPNVDLIVVSVQVDQHFKLVKPAILNNKDVFVEWPLGASLDKSVELTQLAKERNVRTVVGLQARADPLVAKVKEMLRNGDIGRVVSSSVLGSLGLFPTAAWPASASYYLDLDSGGNEYHIYFGHFLDSFIDVLGDFAQLNAIVGSQFPTISLLNDDYQVVVEPAYHKTSPDHIFVQGTLETGAFASIAFRKPQTAVDNVGLRWLITGSEGELEITMPEFHWQMAHPEMKLRIKKGRSGEVQDVVYRGDMETHKADPEFRGTNTTRVYNAFQKNDSTQYATFDSALATHKLLQKILHKSDLTDRSV